MVVSCCVLLHQLGTFGFFLSQSGFVFLWEETRCVICPKEGGEMRDGWARMARLYIEIGLLAELNKKGGAADVIVAKLLNCGKVSSYRGGAKGAVVGYHSITG